MKRIFLKYDVRTNNACHTRKYSGAAEGGWLAWLRAITIITKVGLSHTNNRSLVQLARDADTHSATANQAEHALVSILL